MNGEINKSTLGAALSKIAPEGSANKPPRIATDTTTSHTDTHADALHPFLPAPRPRLHFHYNLPLLILLKYILDMYLKRQTLIQTLIQWIILKYAMQAVEFRGFFPFLSFVIRSFSWTFRGLLTRLHK